LCFAMRILNLEWESRPYRDRIPSSLMSNYLRLLGHEVIEGPVFQGYKMIRTTKPDVIFKSGYFGSVYNYKLMQYAHAQSIPLVMLTAEGGTEDNYWLNPDLFWGWNTKREFLEEKKLLWSVRTRDLLQQILPVEQREKIRVCGGAFFDYYKIGKFLT